MNLESNLLSHHLMRPNENQKKQDAQPFWILDAVVFS